MIQMGHHLGHTEANQSIGGIVRRIKLRYPVYL